MPKAFIVNSQSTKEELKRTFGIRKGVYVLPAAIDEQEIRKIQRRAKKGRTDYFVTVGRLIPEKNIGFAIESMKNVDARLLVIGAGPEKKKLQDKASESGAGDKIKFESGLPDAELFSKIYASLGLILVSKREGLSLISAEAISLGVPVIISDQTMLPEEVRRFCISIKHGSFTEGLRKMAMEAKQRRKEANRKSGAAIRLFSSKRAMPVYNKLLSG
jgi:glycosyltransferase involved in cell wall biosynthesis